MRSWKFTRLLIPLLTLFAGVHAVQAETSQQRMYIGTSQEERGIYASTLDLKTGAMNPTVRVGDAPRPSYLALHPKLPLLYAVTREQTEPPGGVRAFRIDLQGDALTLVNQQPTGDIGPTHLALDPAGEKIVVVHYGGGSTAVLSLAADGEIQTLTTLVKHVGSGPNPKRQQAPHAHGVAIDGGGQYALVTDLGTDEVVVYRLLADGKLERTSAWKSAPGAGPRHVAFHPNGKWLYCIHELNGTMSTLHFDADAGQLTELQTIATLPEGFDGENTTAEVVVHPSGKFVYGSNRGHDSAAVYAVDGETGKLTLVEIEPILGEHPRYIGIEPTGRFLIAANRDTNNLVSFRIDAATGALTPTGHQTKVTAPVCVVFP